MASDSVEYTNRFQQRVRESISNYDKKNKRYIDTIKCPQSLGGRLSSRKGIKQIKKEIEENVLVSSNLRIVCEDGDEKLMLTHRNTRELLEVISCEDAFDVILHHHIELKHADIKTTCDFLKKKYYLPAFCVRLAIKACDCSSTSVPTNVQHEHSGVWRMNITPYSTVNGFDKILIYKHNTTNFLLLRPLGADTHEISVELLKIFLEFGPPQKVLVPSHNKISLKDIFKLWNVMHPDSKILVEKSKESNIIKKDTSEVLTAMDYWYESTLNPNWVIGCHIVQFGLNTSRKQIITIGSEETTVGVPFNLLFGPDAHVDIMKKLPGMVQTGEIEE